MIILDVVGGTRSRSRVVHNHGHGFSKRFTLQGCTNCPLYTSHVRPVSTWLGKRLKLRNVRVPLTNNAHSGWPPVSRHPTQKLATLSNRSLPYDSRFGLPVSSHMRPGPHPVYLGQPRNYVLLALVWFGNNWGSNQHTHVANVNQLGPPLN